MKKLSILTLLTTLFTAPLAMAEADITLNNPSLNKHTGWYGELGAGTNFYYGSLISSDFSDAKAGIHGYGWNANLGYFFNDYVAAELGVMQNYGYFKDDGETTWEHATSPYLVARFNAPLTERVSFIGKIGMMVPTISGVGSLALPYTGVGLSLAATEQLDLSVQYQGAIYGIIGAGLLSVGLTYHI